MKTAFATLKRASLVLGTALLLAASSQAQTNLRSMLVSATHTAAAEDYVGKQVMYLADHIYVQADNAMGYDVQPVWAQETATITYMQRTSSGIRLGVQTESGLTGYIEVSDPSQLSHFIHRLPCSGRSLSGLQS